VWGPEPISARRLYVLIAGLPLEGSALARSVGGDRPGWGNTEELLAGLCELVDITNRQFFMAHSKKGTPPPKPLKVQRPAALDEEPKKRRLATSEELRAFFGASGGTIRYTGHEPSESVELVAAAPGPARCPAGHFARPGQACTACAP
jgi:hypothetical protein